MNPSTLSKAAENYGVMFVHVKIPGWFAFPTFMARAKHPLALDDLAIEQKPKLLNHLLWFEDEKNKGERMQEVDSMRVEPTTEDDLGGRFYNSPGSIGAGPSILTKVQDRLGELLDGYEVFRMKPPDGDTFVPTWPLAGFQAGKLMVVVMPMRF